MIINFLLLILLITLIISCKKLKLFIECYGFDYQVKSRIRIMTFIFINFIILYSIFLIRVKMLTEMEFIQNLDYKTKGDIVAELSETKFSIEKNKYKMNPDEIIYKTTELIGLRDKIKDDINKKNVIKKKLSSFILIKNKYIKILLSKNEYEKVIETKKIINEIENSLELYKLLLNETSI